MSTYLERSTLYRDLAEPRTATRPARQRRAGGSRAVVALAWAELWKRTAGGRFERLPDPATHPECWFKII
jgi:hypothetical protein